MWVVTLHADHPPGINGIVELSRQTPFRMTTATNTINGRLKQRRMLRRVRQMTSQTSSNGNRPVDHTPLNKILVAHATQLPLGNNQSNSLTFIVTVIAGLLVVWRMNGPTLIVFIGTRIGLRFCSIL